MKFELDDYHRDITDEELIEDVKRVSALLNKKGITIDEYDKNGKYNHTTYYRRLGNWKKVLELAELDTESKNFYISNNEYIKDLKRVALLMEKNTITTSEYRKYGRYDAGKLSKRFGGWNEALKLASLEQTEYHSKISELELFHDIEKTWIQLGRQPKTSDIKHGASKYGMTTYIRHFGSWRNALKEFINYINVDNDKTNDIVSQQAIISKKTNTTKQIVAHKTKRDINLRMRFTVFKRDNFKCCICGASPAKDPSVELQVDHIIPWSKGGETELENLQTLCSKCNLGKSNLV